MTIFRLISYLESFGHNITIWIKDFNFLNHPQGPGIDIKRYFQSDNINFFQSSKLSFGVIASSFKFNND